jgi:hypothetical protein
MVNNIIKYYGQLKKQLETSGERGFVVDLDDTIYDTNLFWAAHHLKEISNPEDLTPEELIAKYRYVKDVPYWQNVSLANEWVDQQINSSSSKLLIQVNKNASEFLMKIHKKKPFIGYMTGRPISTNKGTKSSLKLQNIPDLRIIAQPPNYILRELEMRNGNEWKASLLEYLYPQVLGTIDDNIELLAFVNPNYKGTICLYSHPDFTESKPNVVSCPDWKQVHSYFSRIKI